MSGSDSNEVLSGEEQGAFDCDALGKFFDEPGEWGTKMRSLGRWGISR